MRSFTYLLISLTCVFLCGTLWYLFSRGMEILSLGLLAIPLLIYLINHQKVLYIAIIATYFSNIYVPGLTGELQLFYLLVLFASLLAILDSCIDKERIKSYRLDALFAALFILNLVLIICVRGIGIRILGSTEWGGMRYIISIIPFFLIFINPSITFNRKDWKYILVATISLTALPAIAEILFVLSGGTISFLYLFIGHSGGTIASLENYELGSDLVRFQSLNKLGPILVFISVVMINYKSRIWFWLLIYSGGTYLILASGHRSVLIDFLVLSFFGGFYFFKDRLLVYYSTLGICSFLVLLLLFNFAYLLPLSAQRALTILPIIPLSPEAELSALSTVDWRYHVWDLALTDLKLNPEYLFIGKGFTFSGRELESITEYDLNIWWAFITSDYHQGFLSLLITSGIPGLITGTLFMVFSFKMYFEKFLLLTDDGSVLWATSKLLLVYLILLAVKFFTIHGGIHGSLSQLCYMFFILDLLLATQHNEPLSVIPPEKSGREK